MATPASQIARINDLLAKWRAYRVGLPDPALSCQIKTDLYQVRNAGWKGNPPITVWPPDLIDPDDKVMAAVEHYFLCRCWVGTGQFPAWEMRAMNMVYDMGKAAGVTPRHNPTKPTTPLTALQMAAKRKASRTAKPTSPNPARALPSSASRQPIDHSAGGGEEVRPA